MPAPARAPHHLGGPLTLRPGQQRPVHRCAQQIGARQRHCAHPLGEFDVVADHHADATVFGVDEQWQVVRAVEHVVLGVPEVRLAIDTPEPRRVDDGGAVVDLVPGGLGEPGDDGQAERLGEVGPVRDRGTVAGLGQRLQLGAVGEHVPRGREFRQHDDLSARAGGILDRSLGVGLVAGGVTDRQSDLTAGDADSHVSIVDHPAGGSEATGEIGSGGQERSDGGNWSIVVHGGGDGMIRFMRMSAKAEYAVRAMVQLATVAEGVLVKTDDLAKAQSIPPQFLVDILSDLRTDRLVRSHRGRDGGYTLARAAAEISLADVLRCIDGPLASVPRHRGSATCRTRVRRRH